MNTNIIGFRWFSKTFLPYALGGLVALALEGLMGSISNLTMNEKNMLMAERKCQMSCSS